jgi:hypothetical protein
MLPEWACRIDLAKREVDPVPGPDGRPDPRRARRRSWQEYEPTAQSMRNWVGQAECDVGRGGNGLTTAEREELPASA